MGQRLKNPNKRQSNRMKSYVQTGTGKHKFKAKTVEAGRPPYGPVRVGVPDKTLGQHSRPGAKAKARATNRAHTKQARQALNRDLHRQVEEAGDPCSRCRDRTDSLMQYGRRRIGVCESCLEILNTDPEEATKYA